MCSAGRASPSQALTPATERKPVWRAPRSHDGAMHQELEKTLASPRHPYLVFTSAGDQSNLPRWMQGRRNFDLWITYYGSQAGRYLDLADYYNERRGSKFQNLHHAYRHWR